MPKDKPNQVDNYHFTQKLPKKRMASGALIFDNSQRVLLVNPTYRDKWLIPGGMVELDESPRQACIREIKEEIGLDIYPNRLLILDYMSQSEEGTEALHFIFDGGVLNPSQINAIALCNKELSEFRFVEQSLLEQYLPEGLFKRLSQAIIKSSSLDFKYLENGSGI